LVQTLWVNIARWEIPYFILVMEAVDWGKWEGMVLEVRTWDVGFFGGFQETWACWFP